MCSELEEITILPHRTLNLRIIRSSATIVPIFLAFFINLCHNFHDE